MPNEQTKSIFVALVGRPNVGKSSLINRLVGEKVAIVTAKPQTTRTRITGIVTRGPLQYVFLDTPGIHRPRTKTGQTKKGNRQDEKSQYGQPKKIERKPECRIAEYVKDKRESGKLRGNGTAQGKQEKS